jgi:hypothetical protein
MAVQTAMSSAGMLGDLIGENEELTDVFFDDSVKSVIMAASQDSMEGGQDSSTMVLDQYMDSRDAEEMYEDATEDVSLGKLVGLMDMFVGE